MKGLAIESGGGMLWIYRDLFSSYDMDFLEKEKVDSIGAVTAIIGQKYDFIVMPLTLPYLNTLAIAERIIRWAHQLV